MYTNIDGNFYYDVSVDVLCNHYTRRSQQFVEFITHIDLNIVLFGLEIKSYGILKSFNNSR